MLDEMLRGNRTVEEIVEFFRTYQMEDGVSFEPRVYRKSRSSSRQSSVEPDDDILDNAAKNNLTFKVKARDKAKIMNSDTERHEESKSQKNLVVGQRENFESDFNVLQPSAAKAIVLDFKDMNEKVEEQVDEDKDISWNNIKDEIIEATFGIINVKIYK